MTVPPLPDTPCVRVALDYTHDTGLKGGNRFYLSYTGTSPSGADCAALGADIAAAWQANLAFIVNSTWTLTAVDVLDITTDSGLSALVPTSHTGEAAGEAMPAQTASNCEYGISRRYRGGKPRMFLPPPDVPNMLNDTTWIPGFVADLGTGVAAFFTAVQASSHGALTGLQHINLSYYKGFTNVENTSGRMRAAPKYRTPVAVSDKITGYIPKAEIASQRKRRVSTTF